MEGSTCAFFSTLLGLFLLITGLGLTLFGVKNINAIRTYDIIAMTNKSDTFSKWVRPDLETPFKVYIFNVTNPDDVVTGAMPRLKMLGPYVYQQKTEKIDLYSSETSIVAYKIKSSMYFDEKTSGRWKEKDTVLVINVPSICSLLAEPARTKMVNSTQAIFLKTTVKELLFDGVPAEFSACASNAISSSKSLRENNWSAPLLIKKEENKFRFSFFSHKNGIEPETYTMNTGVKSIKNVGKIIAVNHSTFLNLWDSPSCNDLKGTDGTIFPIPLSNDKLYVYDKNFCRSYYVKFEKRVKPEVIDLYRYTLTRDAFDSSKEEKNCGCRPRFSVVNGQSKCFSSGLSSLFSCKGPSLVASLPHFYLGKNRHFNFEGLSPSKSAHQTYYDVEPNFGITISVCKRFQYNVDLSHIEFQNKKAYRFRPGTEIFPVLWSEEMIGITPNFYKQIRLGILDKKILEVVSMASLVLGSCLIIVPYPVWLLRKKFFFRLLRKPFFRGKARIFAQKKSERPLKIRDPDFAWSRNPENELKISRFHVISHE